MGKRDLSYLVIIVILGFVLRFAFLTYSPPSLNWDEISHGYNAYSILKTGMDQWGQRLPIFNFRAYGDYPTTLNLYLTIPFIIIFGLTDFAIRFPHALFGTLTIISVYFLAWGVTKRKEVSLFSAFLAATGPWYLFPSRFVIQSNLAVFFLITSAALFVNRKINKVFLPMSILSLFLTLFSYHTTRIVSPLILFGALFIYRTDFANFFKKKRLLAVILAATIVIFFALSTVILRNPESTARSGVLSILDQGAISKIEAERAAARLPGIISRLVYNRPVYFVEVFAKNYIRYLSPQFLFLQGGTQFQFSIPNFGLIYLVNLPLFYLGSAILLFKLLKRGGDKESRNNYKFILLWLIVAPIPASITNESFAVIRATTMLPIPEILIAVAAYTILDRVKKNYIPILLVFYFSMFYLSFEGYLLNYFTQYRTNYSWSWQYGYKEVVAYAKSHYSDYNRIIVTKKYGEPHEYFLFFWPWNPAQYQDDPNKITFFQSDWYWVDRFDKFYFVNDWQIPKSGYDFVLESKGTLNCLPVASRCLLITSPGDYPKGWKKLDTINFLNGSPAFEIYEN